MVKMSRKYEGLLWLKTLKVIKACLTRIREEEECLHLAMNCLLFGNDHLKT